MSITQEYLQERLHYDPKTGVFTWNFRQVKSRFDKTWNTRYAWYPAGTLHIAGSLQRNKNPLYWRIGIDGKNYPAHRLIFLYMTGKFPPKGVDHKDRDGLNNRWNNLRLATQSQNQANRGLSVNNTSGFKGVSFHIKENRYRASIRFQGKTKRLGYFDKPEEAHAVYCETSKELFGEFSNTA